MKSRIFIIYLALLSLLRAQQATPQDSVSLDIHFVSWGAAVNNLYYKAGSSLKKVEAPAFAASKAIHYTGTPDLTFYTKPAGGTVSNQTPEADELRVKKTDVAAGHVLLPIGESVVTVLLAPTGADQYQCFAIPGDPAKFPFGQAKLVNITSQPLAIQYNRTNSIILNPGDSRVIAPNDNMAVLLVLAAKKGDRWERILDNVFTLNPDEQATVILARGDYKYFLSTSGDMESEVKIVVLRQTKERDAKD